MIVVHATSLLPWVTPFLRKTFLNIHDPNLSEIEVLLDDIRDLLLQCVVVALGVGAEHPDVQL